MLELTDDLRHAIREHPEEPLRLVDATTQRTFVLVSAETYDRLTGRFSDEFDARMGMAMMNRVMAEDDRNDPYLESYQPSASWDIRS